MPFLTTQNQFAVFVCFLFLGKKYALEHFLISFFLKNNKKIVKFIKNSCLAIITLLTCFEFYVLCLNNNFGILRWYMPLGFILGVYAFALIKSAVIKLSKITRKNKMRNKKINNLSKTVWFV